MNFIKRVIKGIVFVGFAIFALAVVIGILKSCGSSTGSGGSMVPVDRTPAWTGTAKDLQCYYEQNEVKADGQFKNQWVIVTARVAEISKDFMDKPYVVLDADCDNMFLRPQAHFSESNLSYLSELSKNQKVTIKCKVKSFVMKSLMLEDCEPQ